MKRSAVLQERISLFPFLAVLICTMGALLVLLVVIAQRAQATAQLQQEAEARAQESEAKNMDASLLAEISSLTVLREQASQSLTQQRKVLAHIEDHMRRIGERLRQIQDTRAALSQSPAQSSTNPEKLREELARLRQQRTEAKKLLAKMISEIKPQTSYSIVPYLGAHGTQRRPVYLECHAKGIIFQPEGIRLEETDFARPLGPENPLAAGLRAYSSYVRDHIAAPAGKLPADPYPLLLVRPSGIPAYYAARTALQSWNTEFGYELIEEDWDLDFPFPDPSLAQVTLEAIELARPRHQYLVQQHRQAERQQRRRRAAQPGYGRLVDLGSGNDGTGFGSQPGGHGSGTHGSDIDRNRAAIRKKIASQAGDTNHSSGTGESDGNTSPSTASGQEGRSASLSLGSKSHGAPPQQTEPASGQLSISYSPPQSIAKVRGSNWALPGASSGSVPFARPIRIECSADQLTLVPSDLREAKQAITFDGNTKQALEIFVSAVWKHMRTWGIAGRGLYWKPILKLYVHPGAELRAKDLEALLDRSGLEVQRQ
jgi:hypothetical protein